MNCFVISWKLSHTPLSHSFSLCFSFFNRLRSSCTATYLPLHCCASPIYLRLFILCFSLFFIFRFSLWLHCYVSPASLLLHVLSIYDCLPSVFLCFSFFNRLCSSCTATYLHLHCCQTNRIL